MTAEYDVGGGKFYVGFNNELNPSSAGAAVVTLYSFSQQLQWSMTAGSLFNSHTLSFDTVESTEETVATDVWDFAQVHAITDIYGQTLSSGERPFYEA